LIETPSAVFSIEDILRQADFISIGTNDLTQFILAADRNALATIDSYTVLHPSVLRALCDQVSYRHLNILLAKSTLFRAPFALSPLPKNTGP
jgi:phosphoenolpyruvate-protein kinase (PTS system EI component)